MNIEAPDRSLHRSGPTRDWVELVRWLNQEVSPILRAGHNCRVTLHFSGSSLKADIEKFSIPIRPRSAAD